MRASAIVVVACAAVALAACGFTEDKGAAAAFADRYFAAAALDDVTAVLPFYSPRFFITTPRERWVEALRQHRDRCGKPSSHELENWMVTRTVGMNAGTMVKLVYAVRYERCQTRETLMIFRPLGGDFGIEGHSAQITGSAPAGSEKTTTV
jgi:hypothetical protein